MFDLQTGVFAAVVEYRDTVDRKTIAPRGENAIAAAIMFASLTKQLQVTNRDIIRMEYINYVFRRIGHHQSTGTAQPGARRFDHHGFGQQMIAVRHIDHAAGICVDRGLK